MTRNQLGLLRLSVLFVTYYGHSYQEKKKDHSAQRIHSLSSRENQNYDHKGPSDNTT